MLELIADEIKIIIETLNWSDQVVGIVMPVKIKVGDKDGTTTDKTVPGSYNKNPTTCNPGEIITFTPDTKKKSVVYQEAVSESIQNEWDGFLEITAEIRIVAWLNLKRINKNIKDSILIQKNLIQNIPEQITGISGLQKCDLHFQGITRSPEIFSAYTYDEAENQFLIYPFDYFALNYQVDYRTHKSCYEAITINPDSCLRY